MIKNIIIFILSIIVFICLINYAVDFAFFLFYRYCRFHIGRMQSAEWQIAVEKKAVKWLKHTPTVKISDNSRYMLLDMLTGKYNSSIIQSWQIGALIWGLYEKGTSESKAAAKSAALNLLNEKSEWKVKPLAVDSGLLSCAVLLASEDAEKVLPAMNETLEVMKKQTSKAGMLSYTGGPENPELYVDTLGLACPFLCLYAKTYQQPELEELAFKQLETFHQYGLYTDTILPNHAFNFKNKLPAGVYGWGRGIGWYVIGLMDSITYMQDQLHISQVNKWIKEAADYYMQFQRDDGGFGATIQRAAGYDSSATAVLAWFYGKCGQMYNSVQYKTVAEKCLEKLRTVTRITGALDWCQGDTKDIGVFAQTYDIMPFAQGFLVRSFERN